MEYDNSKKNSLMKNARVQTKQTAIPLNHELRQYERPPSSRNARVQTELTSIGINDETMHYRRNSKKMPVQIVYDPSYVPGVAYPNSNDKDRLVQNDANDITADRLDTDLLRLEQDDTTTPPSQTVEASHEPTDLPTEPILEYADEPLLPLAEACAPLDAILHNLSYYVQLALEETPQDPPDRLTIDESAAIRLYTIEWDRPHRSLYSMLNYTLKNENREKLRPYFRYMKLFITALVKLPCMPPCTVWRGVTKDLSQEFPPGTPVTWWAFSSCTTELTVLENNMYLGSSGHRTLFSVEVINGRTVRAHSHFVTEDELLLLPGTHMIVQSLFSPAPQLHIIHLKQVIPDEPLLKPPYDGNFVFFPD